MVGIGEPAAIGPPLQRAELRPRSRSRRARRRDDERGASRDAEIVDAWFEDPHGERITAIAHREPCCACCRGPLQRAARGSDLRRDAAQRCRRDGVRDDDRARRRLDRAISTPARRSSCGAIRELAWRQPLHADPSVARDGTGRPTHRPARGHRVARRPRRPLHRRRRSTSRTASRSSAVSATRRSA